MGIPDSSDRNRLKGLLGSLGLHLLVVLIFVVPLMLSDVIRVREHRQAGGADVPGGGGGGRGGTGGLTIERLYYVPLTPPTTAVPETPRAVVPRPVQLAPPPPPTPKPEVVPESTPIPIQPPVQPVPPPSQAAAPAASQAGGAPTIGEGGGTGRDGSDGSGPGSGGGVGSGIGTGRGSGLGPGTGGGPDSIYPPTLLTLTLPPLDAPAKVRPYRLVAFFDVDEKGKTTLLGFNETSDSRFNRRVRDVLGDVRFRPAVRMDGRPVRDTGRFEIEYP